MIKAGFDPKEVYRTNIRMGRWESAERWQVKVHPQSRLVQGDRFDLSKRLSTCYFEPHPLDDVLSIKERLTWPVYEPFYWEGAAYKAASSQIPRFSQAPQPQSHPIRLSQAVE
jgi:hypothetical protein